MLQGKVPRQRYIMPVNDIECEDNCRKKQDNDPCAIGKLRDGENQRDNCSDKSAKSIDDQLPVPARVIGVQLLFLRKLLLGNLPVMPPVTRHA